MHIRSFQRRKEATKRWRHVGGEGWEKEPEGGKNWEAWNILEKLSFF